MITQHKALFNMGLSLACSLMSEKERQQVSLKFYTSIKKEDEILLKEDYIKQESYVSMEDDI